MTFRQMLGRLGIILAAIAILVYALRLPGIVQDFWFWWGLFTAILVTAQIVDYLTNTHYVRVSGWVVFSIVMGLLSYRTMPIALDWLGQKFPTAKVAAIKRAHHTDLQIAQELLPVGTSTLQQSIDRLSDLDQSMGNYYYAQLRDVNAKLGQNQCWGWDPTQKPGSRSVRITCTAPMIAEQFVAVVNEAEAVTIRLERDGKFRVGLWDIYGPKDVSINTDDPRSVLVSIALVLVALIGIGILFGFIKLPTSSAGGH